MTELKKIFKIKIIFEFLLFILLYRSFEIAGIKKYVVAIIFCFLCLFLARKKEWDVANLCIAIPAVTYLVIGSMMGMIHGTYQFDTIKIILYGILSFMIALSLYACYGKDIGRIVDVQFFSCCIVYLSLTIVYMLTRFSRVESTFAFVFGIFTIYYAYQKRWKMFALSAVFMYLADKRIVLLGVAVSLLLLLILWLFEYNKKLVYAGWSIVAGFVFIYLYSIYSGILEAFCWGANINTNGRVEMYGRMARECQSFFGGKGLGVVENLLECWNISDFANLHNDLLKFQIELGFLGLFIYLLSYCVMFHLIGQKIEESKISFLFVISVYSMLLYATDNVSIYVMYLLPMYSVFFAVLSSEKETRIGKKDSI